MRFICGVPYNTTFSKHKSIKKYAQEPLKNKQSKNHKA